MTSLWNNQEAIQHAGDLGQRVYTSRLLGRDPALVLHGGGNTSVKISETNLFGEEEQILWIKGSGRDLQTIDATGFSPCRLAPLLRLAQLPALSDTAMARELKASMSDPSAPAPSVEAILHAIIPHKFVEHTHADSLIAVMNTPDGESRVREIYGDRVVILPYVMPGFQLARLCAEHFPKEAGTQTVGIVLLQHGLLTFGETARESYERMIELVTLAENDLDRHGAWNVAASAPATPQPPPPREQRGDIARLRRDLSQVAGKPMILISHRDENSTAFARREDIATLSQQGPATPDHVVRTKRLPMLGRNLDAYRSAYEQYFQAHAARAGRELQMLDPAPRVILDPGFGMLTAGPNAREAAIAGDVYRHTIDIILRATALGGYRALPAEDLFDVEYWDLEQAKLRSAAAPPMFAGEIALVTGAASGIGKACVAALLRRGAAVIGLDLQSAIVDLHHRPDYSGFVCDLTDESQIVQAMESAVQAFGGLDMLVLNAGIFPKATPLSSLSTGAWRQVMQVNLDANLMLLREAHPLLKLAPNGGRVVVIGSKNVPAPGPGVAAYSASKAALQQLVRVAALEWGSDKIRLNTIHPNAVFDTGLWTDEVLAARARSYGVSVEEYKTKNVLGVEVRSQDVAELAAELCGPTFAKTTGAQIPVDGGNERVI
jgi:rhamnose utilization protein RhaD (predicted bifunctional aldolase and dehydrogenase)/NAD(P)-dependent dehydrogenase (short-subunit alcohol dehydrogenase family)